MSKMSKCLKMSKCEKYLRISKNVFKCLKKCQNVSKYPVDVRRSSCINAIMSDSGASDSPRNDSSEHRFVVLDANEGTARVALARVDSAFCVSGANHLIFNYCLTFVVVLKCFCANFWGIFFWLKIQFLSSQNIYECNNMAQDNSENCQISQLSKM